jgi:uncharacterized delta-60 repeat protein
MRSRLGSRVAGLAWIVIAWLVASVAAAAAATQDITAQFAVTRSGLVLNRTTNTFDQTVTLRNTSGAPVLGAVNAAVSGLPAGVTLFNATGQTADAKPFVTPLGTGAMLANGSSLSFTLKYANPSRVTFTSVVQLLYSVEVPPSAPKLFAVTATGTSGATVIGRVEGLGNRDITLQATAAATCVLGTLVSGTPVGGALATHTDADGYFSVSVPGVSPGSFVTLKLTAPAATPGSPCLVSSKDNDAWPKAFLLDGTAPVVRDYIDAPGKTRWYRFAVTPGQRIDVKLAGLPADYDLTVFRDIAQAFASQFNPATAGAGDLLKLAAEYAPSVFSPSVFSPSVFSPSVFSPDAYAPSVFSPSVFSPSVFSPSVFSPSVLSPSVFSPSVFSPSVFSSSVYSPSVFSPSVFSPSVFSADEIAKAFSTAQTRSVVAVSATAGLSDEATAVNTWNRTGHFYVRVSSRGAAFSTSAPFTLTVTRGATTCAGVTDFNVTARALLPASGRKTVILTDSSRVALDVALPGAVPETLRTKLAAFATRSEVGGVVVDVAGDARVAALKQQAANNPACPFAKNLVAEEIKGIVDSYRANPLQYVVLAGNDDAIPFFRSPDQAGLGAESGYVPPVQSNSPSEASLRLDFVLSQDRYGAKTTLALPWNDLPVPDLAVGRLVESAAEIGGLIDAYLAAGGVITPRSSLVTGYDFLEDAAGAVKGELDAGIGAAGDALITPNGRSPQDPASWTAAQLRASLFGARHDVIFLAGHFSANSALAADFTTSVLTHEVGAAAVDFTNAIVFSAGCHSGYNLVDGEAIPGVTLPLDWAQAFTRRKATLIAGTGYQYGDTDFLEYSERLYHNFARQLRTGPGVVPIGAALVRAKLAYLGATSDLRGIHEKALLEATLFGLPMLGVNMPGARLPGDTIAAIAPAPVGSGPAATLGLQTFDLALAPGLTSRTQTLKNLEGGADIVASWFNGPDSVFTRGGEPALPLAVVDVTPSDPQLVLRGVGYRGGTFVDAGPMFPFSGAPTTESRGVHVPFLSPVFYPTTMWTPNYFGALSGGGGTRLLVTPVQHRAANVVTGTSTQRRHTGLNLRLFYSANLSQAALSDAPSIVAVDTQRDGAAVVVAAQVIGDPAAAVHQVWVTYSGDGTSAWTSLDLAQCVRSGAPGVLPAACGATDDSRVWMGHIAAPPTNIRHFVQAVSGVGLVARNDNLGAYFGIPGITPAATTLALVAAPSAAIIGDTPTVTAKLTYASGVGVAGRVVSVGAGGATQLGTTGSDGSVTVTMPVVATPGAYQITAAFAGDDTYQPSSASAPLTVNKATVTPTVLAASVAPAAINVASALGGTSAGLQQVPVAFTVTGPSGTTTVWAITDYLGNATFPPPSGLPPGDYTVTQASFGGDGTFAPTTITFPTPRVVTVPKVNQGIAFDALADRTLGEPDFAVYASASSALVVTYGASGACTIAGNTVHLTGAGVCTITADQAGNATYNAAPTVARNFSIFAPVTVASLVRAVPNPTMADSVTWTLTFSEPVTGVTAGNFSLAASALTGASVASVSGADATWTVTVNTGRGSGTLRLDVANASGIVNGSGRPLTGTPFAGETYQVDKGGTVVGAGEGQLVTSFGSGGLAVFATVPDAASPSALAVLADGKILAAGADGCTPIVPSDPDSAHYCSLQLARYLATGALDASFGTGGRVTAAVTSVAFELSGLFVRTDGTFLVAGHRHNGVNDEPFVARFTANGAADASYGTGGVAVLSALPLSFGIMGSAIDASGQVVIVGTAPPAGPEGQDIFVTRLTSAGATDATFGSAGVARFAVSATGTRHDRGTTVAIQPDGKIVVGGRTMGSAGLGFDFLLLRLETTGAPDASFGTGGIATTRFPTSTGNNLGRKLALQPDGKIVLVGTIEVGAALACGVARFEASGALDPGYGTGGQMVVSPPNGCFNVSLQTDGKAIVVANNRVGDVNYASYLRLLRTGTPDPAFGTAGVMDISAFDSPGRVAFTADGKIVTGLTIQDAADGVVKSYTTELTAVPTGPWVSQTIAFAALPDHTFGDVFTVSATATSGLPVSFAASGVCVVSGTLVQVTGVGSCTITASQAGDATWLAAAPVPRTFSVTSAAQAITFAPAPSGVTAGQPLVMVSATSGSSTAPSTNPIVFSSLTPSVCTTGGINGARLTLLAPGTCTIAADQSGDGNYDAAAQATQSFVVGAAGTPPSTFTVTNLNDSGAGSLRDAIGQANANPGPDVVNFAGGLTGTIVLTSGQIQISGPLSIEGPGAGVLTIDGNGVANVTPWSRIFSIYVADLACPDLDGPDYLVAISGLRLTNGRNRNSGGSGGAIYTHHSLALDSVVIDNSAARAGGGVSFLVQYPGQTLTVANSTFLDNRATELVAPTGVTSASGGAIHVSQRCANALDLPHTEPVSVAIANSEFRRNASQPTTLNGRGGALRSYSLADIAITDTIVVDNHADAPDPPASGRNYHGGGFDGTAKSLRIERSEIAENTAWDVTGADVTRSGAMHLYKDAVDRQGQSDAMAVKIVNSTISGNASSATAGAMVAFGNIALEIVNSTVSDNVAAPTRTGGVIASLGATNPVSGSNTARPTVRLVSSILANNSSSGGDFAAGVATLGPFTVTATSSLFEKFCASPTCAITVAGSGNVLGVDPMLDVLASNPPTAWTRTHALLPGSPAINTGSNPLGLAFDQRGAGFPRTIGAGTDMGAYESPSP